VETHLTLDLGDDDDFLSVFGVSRPALWATDLK